MSRPPRRSSAKRSKASSAAPQTITLDGYAASRRAVRELKADGSLPADTKLRSSKYLNNLIEQDHRGVKQRIAVMLGSGVQECGDHDRRHRAGAPHPQGTVRTGPSGRSRRSCACSLERGAWGLKSARRSTEAFARALLHQSHRERVRVRHRTVRTRGALSQDTARLMVFKLIMAAAKTWRRLKGENQLPKVVAGVTFRNGVEVTDAPRQSAA